jgi:hypothetical protein
VLDWHCACTGRFGVKNAFFSQADCARPRVGNAATLMEVVMSRMRSFCCRRILRDNSKRVNLIWLVDRELVEQVRENRAVSFRVTIDTGPKSEAEK